MLTVNTKLRACIAAALLAIAPSAFAADNINNNDTSSMNNDDVKVVLTTDLGDITLLLYGDTPAHRDNFVKLVEQGTYEGTLFHRVIKEFMIQGGDPESRTAKPGQSLGSGDVGYTLAKEIVYPKHFHKRGALAAARTGDQVNPERRSSGCQFYIVTGRKFSPDQLSQMEKSLQGKAMQDYFMGLARARHDEIMRLRAAADEAGLNALQDELVAATEAHFAANPAAGFTPEQKEAYATVGGAPHLDGDYTVYGEVINGMDVVDKIEAVATDKGDRPLSDVHIIGARVVK